MSDINNVCITGRVAQDVRSAATASGTFIAEMVVAVNKRGGEADETAFIPVIAFNKMGEACAKWLKKGAAIAIVGRIIQDRWTDKVSGKMRSALKVIATQVEFLDQKPQGQQGQGTQPAQGQYQQAAQPRQTPPPMQPPATMQGDGFGTPVMMEDDTPF